MTNYKDISRYFRALLLLLMMLFFISENGFSQYFGRNKPSYQRFEFNVYQTPNFDIYHYFEDDSIPEFLANTYEKWYLRHQKLFRDTFETQNPILIYANHPDFQQTTAVSSMIGVGTQGVTEALKNRVVMPILETNAQTDHVIGHELVHVFQFRKMFLEDSLSLNSMQNLPLWLVEGMAEYFSIGSVGAHTAMIMRDAIHNDDFPSLRDMTRSYQYNPYRFGHGFVSFFGRTWGDSLIVPLFSETAKFGYERAIERIVGLSARTVSNMWKASYITHYEPLMADSVRHVPVGQKIISPDNSGNINISPSISPDGRFVAFFSERDLLSIDLFLADAKTGEIVSKLSSASRTGDIDGYNFFESMGTWSPDGKRFAHVAVKQGMNQLIIVDVDRPRSSREIQIPGVPSFNNPVWSPDGDYIVFNGLVEGRPNLFKYVFATKEVQWLTDDRYSYAHASFSPDGRYLAFATDRSQTYQEDNDQLNLNMNLAIMDLEDENHSIRVLDVFPGADNVNPVFAIDQSGMYFLTNADGYRNLHFFDLGNGDVFRLTDFYTGISGITHMTPSISIARETGDIVYSHYQNGKYSILSAQDADFERVKVDPMVLDMTAAVLPPFERPAPPIVDASLDVEPIEGIWPVDSFAEKPFDPRFGLSFIGSSGVGVATSRFGTGMSGGVSMMFSDIIGDNQLFTTLAVNGEIYDFGGMVAYLNQKGKINWGGSLSHIPYIFSRLNFFQEEDFEDIYNMQLLLIRQFEDQVSGFAFYPISTTRRIEASASLVWYYYRVDAINNYYQSGYPILPNESLGLPYRERLDAPDGFALQRLNLAYVGDNSYFGMASPMAGYRYRLSGERMFGRVNMYSVTADYRHYFQLRPVTFAVRGIHYGRYGSGATNDIMYPLYLAYPGFVRGYDYSTLNQLEETFGDDPEMINATFRKLQGTRVLLGGLEVRLPFTGPERLALISSGFFFTELSWFLDAGIAYDSNSQLTLDPATGEDPDRRFPFFSTGPSLRINVFGALILEPYIAFPFHTKGIQEGVWGLNFLPGW